MTGLVGASVTQGIVLPEWIDINGHMNVAFYVLAFDKAVDDLWARLGITEQYIQTERASTFAVECHVTYQRELQEGEPYRITSQILAYDEKRIHQFQRMYQADEGFLAATAEWMNLHVDLEARKVSPWPKPVLEALDRFAREQYPAEFPAEAGKRMAIKRPVYAMRVNESDG